VSVDIEDFVNKCETCIKRSLIKHQPVVDEPLPQGPWEEIAADLFVFDHCNYLVVIDYYSKWIETAKLLDQTSVSVIKELRRIFSCYGIPSKLRSDNGRCFDSRQMRDFADHWGFTHDTSSPRYPQSNGLAERAVGIVKKLWSGNGDRDAALLAYRTTPLKCGYSPSQLLYARAVRSGLGQPIEEFVDYELFETFMEREKELAKEKWDKKYRAKTLPRLKAGERVWVKSPSDPGKEGIVVREDTHPDSYWVKVGDSEIRRNRKHLFSLEGSSTEEGFLEGGEAWLDLSSWENGNIDYSCGGVAANLDFHNVASTPNLNTEADNDVRANPDLSLDNCLAASAPNLDVEVNDRMLYDHGFGDFVPEPGGDEDVGVVHPDRSINTGNDNARLGGITLIWQLISQYQLLADMGEW
jgi:hypothetical protein